MPPLSADGPLLPLHHILLHNHTQYLASLARIHRLLDTLATTHTHLNHTLYHLLTALPPTLHSLTGAQANFISATIESSLLRISLLRARAQRALYRSHEPSVMSAIDSAYRKLKTHEALIRQQELSLDQQLAQYEQLLTLVDGSQGAFRQIVNDWTTVNKDTEQCRTDLRRLGWTAD